MTKARKMTPKDFVPHLLAVLGTLTKHQANVSVPMQETYDPVCARMEIEPENFGKSEHGKKGNKTPWVHRQIGLAFRQMRDNGLGQYASRGHWSLTEAGVDQLGTAEIDVAQDDKKDDKKDEPNVVRLSASDTEHPYSDDPYIRGLAVQGTPCFGAYSTRSDVCKGCLLREDCISAISIRKAQIAADLEREEMEAKRAAEAQKKKKDQQDASIDELMQTMGVDDVIRYEPRPGQVISTAFAQLESICGQCNERIPKDDPCYWVKDEGLFHPACINARGGTQTHDILLEK
jgi:hypothetical protein